MYQKQKSKINKKIQQGLKSLFNSNIGNTFVPRIILKGLQSILMNEGTQFFDRTLIEEPEECKQTPSDTKSNPSESNSMRTHVSSTSTGDNSIKSSNEVISASSIANEDLTQKYYKELRNSLKSNRFSS